MSELASESMSQRPRIARERASVRATQCLAKPGRASARACNEPAEPRGTAAGGAGGVGRHSEAER